MQNSMKVIESKYFISLFILYHFIYHTIITKNNRKISKKEVAWRPNRNYSPELMRG